MQLAATYAQDLPKNSRAAIDGPVLFLNPFVIVFVSLLGLVGFIIELKIGFGVKPWWEAPLLPIPPFAMASVWYRQHNPAPPFFTGLFALLLAIALKFLT